MNVFGYTVTWEDVLTTALLPFGIGFCLGKAKRGVQEILASRKN